MDKLTIDKLTILNLGYIVLDWNELRNELKEKLYTINALLKRADQYSECGWFRYSDTLIQQAFMLMGECRLLYDILYHRS